MDDSFALNTITGFVVVLVFLMIYLLESKSNDSED